METVSHKAAEKLADSIGDKTAGNRKSGQAFADIQGTLDLSKAGSIIQTEMCIRDSCNAVLSEDVPLIYGP